MQHLYASHMKSTDGCANVKDEPDIEFFQEMERRFARHKLEELANASE